MWSWAEKRGFVTEINPCLGFEKYKEIKRKRYLTEDEVLRLGKAIELEKKINPYAIVAIQLLIMTGARLSEILQSKWDWIKDDILYLPDSKSGKKEITLPSPVLKTLEKIKHRKKLDTTVFCIIQSAKRRQIHVRSSVLKQNKETSKNATRESDSSARTQNAAVPESNSHNAKRFDSCRSSDDIYLHFRRLRTG